MQRATSVNYLLPQPELPLYSCVALNQEFCQIQLYDEMLRDVKTFSVSVGPGEALSCNNFVLLYVLHV